MSSALGSELDRVGFAVVHQVLAPEVVGPLRADLRVATAEHGSASGDLPDALRRVPAATALLGSSAVTDLVDAACGPGASLRLCKASVTTSAHPPLALHADATVWMTPPFPAGAELVTLLFALDPIDRNGGCTTIVPGSHQRQTEPTATEIEAETARVVDTELGAGDVLVWRGATWHGRRRRVAPGERVVLVAAYGTSTVPAMPRA